MTVHDKTNSAEMRSDGGVDAPLGCSLIRFSACRDDPASRNWTTVPSTGADPFYYNDFNGVYNCMVMNGAQIVNGGMVRILNS